jgi:hypothetical protein
MKFNNEDLGKIFSFPNCIKCDATNLDDLGRFLEDPDNNVSLGVTSDFDFDFESFDDSEAMYDAMADIALSASTIDGLSGIQYAYIKIMMTLAARIGQSLGTITGSAMVFKQFEKDPNGESIKLNSPQEVFKKISAINGARKNKESRLKAIKFIEKSLRTKPNQSINNLASIVHDTSANDKHEFGRIISISTAKSYIRGVKKELGGASD